VGLRRRAARGVRTRDRALRIERGRDLLVRAGCHGFDRRRAHLARLPRILRGSYCPHYDGEKDRRPTYQRLVGEGRIAGGIACDDGAGAHFIDERLERIVSARPNARGYLVERIGGEVRESVLEPVGL
jgi:hypothetical protein